MIRACPRASIASSRLVDRLRRDCPWDREQSFETLKTYLLEETYETLAAIDEGRAEPLEGELGDLLFQVFFLARLAAGAGLVRHPRRRRRGSRAR